MILHKYNGMYGTHYTVLYNTILYAKCAIYVTYRYILFWYEFCEFCNSSQQQQEEEQQQEQQQQLLNL